MIRRLGLDGRHMAEIYAYACIEPVGEGMVDYNAGDGGGHRAKQGQRPMDQEKRRALLKGMFPAKKKET